MINYYGNTFPASYLSEKENRQVDEITLAVGKHLGKLDFLNANQEFHLVAEKRKIYILYTKKSVQTAVYSNLLGSFY